MIPVPTALDDLEQRVVALDAQLPAQRSADERDAASAMITCVHELRRLVDALPTARMRYIEARDMGAQEAAHIALRRLIHDLRTPAGVLYTYLRLVASGTLFATAAADQRHEAAALVDLVLAIRDEAKAEG